MIQRTVCVLPKKLDGLFCECKSILYLNERKREGLGDFLSCYFQVISKKFCYKSQE